ncbi:MAG: sugar-transfer associated ATP-grasp domain-containing protein, partial [Pseudomonas sp.]
TWLNNIITKHPDTTNAVDGVQLPNWDGFMKLAAGCYELCGLGYIGVDMVLDQEKGPLILELNARPGLNIQIANDCGLTLRTHAVEARLEELKAAGVTETPEERVKFVQEMFGHIPAVEG